MKTPFSLALLVLLAPSLSEAFVPAFTTVLSCELVDAASGRVLDQLESPTDPQAPGYVDPILFLFSRGKLNGTVRDTAGTEQGERLLELTLSYQDGMSSGYSSAGGSYLRGQVAAGDPIAQTSLSDGYPGFETILRCFHQARAGSSAPGADRILSTITYENGNGNSSGLCDSNMSWFCYDDLKRRARDAAARDAQWRCELRQGKADTFFPSCNDFCSPFSLPPNSGSQWVSCQSTCSIRCEIP